MYNRSTVMRNERKSAFIEIIRILLVVFILITICFVVFSSCTNDEDAPTEVEDVLLVYLAGDNNLSGESHDKFENIVNRYGGANCRRILAYLDSREETPQLIEITDKNKYQVLENYSAENSADPEVLGRVIAKAKSLYPQADFNFLVFSHATGWLPEGHYTSPRSAFETMPSKRSILVDENSEMDLSDFAQAIPDNMFEYIIFETCHMAGIEVAYELKHKAKYIVASSAEIVSPGFTDVYSSNINDLVNGKPTDFMQAAFNFFNNQTAFMCSATFSVIETSKLGGLAAYIRDNCDFTRVIEIEEIQYFDRKSYHLFYDFEDYYSRLLKNDEQQKRLSQLIDECVIWKASTPYFMEGYNGFSIDRHSGLTTYIMQDNYPDLNAAYKKNAWYKSIAKK